MKPDKFSAFGIASILPGMRYMAERMQQEIKYLEQALEAHQENREEGLRRVAQQVNREFGFDSQRGEFSEPKRRGRPPGKGRGKWRTASGRLMNEEERREEALRRRAKWSNPRAKKAARANGALRGVSA